MKTTIALAPEQRRTIPGAALLAAAKSVIRMAFAPGVSLAIFGTCSVATFIFAVIGKELATGLAAISALPWLVAHLSRIAMKGGEL